MEVLDAPSGRRPRESLLRLSRWFHSLSADDQARLNAVVAEVVDRTLFRSRSAAAKQPASPEPLPSADEAYSQPAGDSWRADGDASTEREARRKWSEGDSNP